MSNKTVKEFLDITDFSDIDEVDIFEIHDGITYEYEVIENSIEECCIRDFGDAEIAEFWINEYEGQRILSINVYG